jgi:hypothetical protein
MKTTVEIADGLFLDAKRVAVERNTTLKSLVEEGLRLVVERSAVAPPPYRPVTFRGGGPVDPTDLGFWENIRDHAYGVDGESAL